jgi:hypothetical protein
VPTRLVGIIPESEVLVSGLYNFHLCSTLQSAKDPLPARHCVEYYFQSVAGNAARRCIVLVVGAAAIYGQFRPKIITKLLHLNVHNAAKHIV